MSLHPVAMLTEGVGDFLRVPTGSVDISQFADGMHTTFPVSATLLLLVSRNTARSRHSLVAGEHRVK